MSIYNKYLNKIEYKLINCNNENGIIDLPKFLTGDL